MKLSLPPNKFAAKCGGNAYGKKSKDRICMSGMRIRKS